MRLLPWLLLVAAPSADDRSVGVLWHEQATGDDALRQRVIETIAETLQIDPGQVIPDGISEARRLVAHQLEPERIDELGQLGQRLADATLRFRAGELMPAWDEAAGVIESLREEPLLPGAAALAWRAHLLRAQVAWTQADLATTDVELRAAIALDPTARLTTRRVPPDFAERYESQRSAILADPTAWSAPKIEVKGEDDLEVSSAAGGRIDVEIDGEPGLRAVPPGEHFVVVRRLGARPFGAVVRADGRVEVPPAKTVIARSLPARRKDAQEICDRLETDLLVLARRREQRLGLQAFDCGSGYGDPWFSPPRPDPQVVEEGVRVALGVTSDDGSFDATMSRVASTDPWPRHQPAVALQPEGQEPTDRVTKPWYKRAWVWVVIGTVVVGGVTTGAVLGTRQADQVYKVGNGFLD